MDSKTNFWYDFAGIFFFSKIENVYINTFLGKTLDIPYAFQMLCVRWYEVDDSDPGFSGWDSSTLDMLHFPPLLHQDNSFGFVDPEVVLRGCHILPAFDKGMRESNVNVSRSAKDKKDYLLYYVGR